MLYQHLEKRMELEREEHAAYMRVIDQVTIESYSENRESGSHDPEGADRRP